MRLNEIDPNVLEPGDKTSMGDEFLNDPEKIIEYVRQHCSDIIGEMQATRKFLYRGIKRGELAPAFVGQSRQDRRPKDTANDVSAFFDKALASHGFKALRGNSIFVTSDYDHALSYGDTVYAIFPINGFQYTYTDSSDLVIKKTELIEYPKDLIPATTKWLNDNEEKILADAESNSASPTERRRLLIWKEIRSHLNYLERLVVSMNKIESDRSSYFLLLHNLCRDLAKMAAESPVDPFVQKFRNFDVSDPDTWSMDGVIKNLNPKNTNIKKAMKAGREIFINGRYVALSDRQYIKPFLIRLVGGL